MYEMIAFYLFSALTIGLFLITVMSKNVLYAMTSLAAGMVLISGFFFILGADFLGVVQLIVYVGAIMALYSFAMMFFDATKDIKEKNTNPALVFVLGGLSALALEKKKSFNAFLRNGSHAQCGQYRICSDLALL